MRHNARSRLQLWLPHLSPLALDPQRANLRALFSVQSTGKINDRAPGIAGAFPVFACTLRVSRKKSEVHMRKLFRPQALNEVDFVTRGFELADRFVVIEQTNIYGREVALAEHLSNFLPFERTCANNGRAIKLPPRGRDR